jgi:RNA polymerase sigma-70 factor (sigma-E family)
MRHVGNRGDDEAAFREYVLARGTALLRMAIMLTGNRADAEDLVQAALAKTYLAWGKINDRAALDAYVRRAMVNTHISWWRRRKLEEFPTDELPDQAVADHAVESDLAEVVRRALDRLPRRMRAAVMLRYFEDMTEPEIAAALGISLGTVKSTVSRAVARLRIDAELGEGSGGLSNLMAFIEPYPYLSAYPVMGRPGRGYCGPPDSWHYAGMLVRHAEEVAPCGAR